MKVAVDLLRHQMRRALLAPVFLLCGMVAFSLLVTPAFAGKRVALVVGNSDYQVAGRLKNAVNDANSVSSALERLGFEVTKLTDTNSSDFWITLEKFNKTAEGAESVLFFYSGHAFQVSGANYLVPVDAKLQNPQAITKETWDLNGIINRLSAHNRQTLIFLDACRNNPLPESVRAKTSTGNGLARIQTGTGTFVAFATEPGAVTFDGTGDNSPFTNALLSNIETPGISISDLMIRVRNQVEDETFRKQTPWDQSSLRSQFYFNEATPAKPGLTVADFEMLASLPPADRAKMLALLEASGISTEAAADVVSSLTDDLAVVDDGGIMFDDMEVGQDEQVAALPAESDDETGQGGILEVVDDGFEIFDDDDTPTQVARAEPTPQAEVEVARADPQLVTPGTAAAIGTDNANTKEREVIRLAALTSATRSIPFATDDTDRIVGKEVSIETEEGRAILAAIDPNLVKDLENSAIEEPANIKKAVQAELKRLGCYRSSVDGIWGKGSRTALSRYFLAKKIVPDGLEPTLPLYRQLTIEEKVVCKTSVASVNPTKKIKKAPAKATTKKATTKKTTTKKTAKKTAPSGKKSKLKKSTLGAGVFR